ncbi:MAG: VWA domain-containing protein [Candidatus Nanohaloarchaeota archaeon QJJ-5]|nr:VWA domain-containing protein [Candidatus Nanohaloarchaeota archaeon QJJ-5]
MNTETFKIAAILVLLVAGAGDVLSTDEVGPTIYGIDSLVGEKIDDWQFSRSDTERDIEAFSFAFHIPGQSVFGLIAGVPFMGPGTAVLPLSALSIPYFYMSMMRQPLAEAQMSAGNAAGDAAGSGDLGLTAGGAQDIQNFRDNIENGYLPAPTDITYQGLYFQYYLDRGQSQECTQLFCPSYSQAVSEDPLTDEEEQFMTVGLNSNLAQDEFERKKLNMVLVLDISGSMGSGFEQYYYDRFGNRRDVNTTSKSKMTVAAESLAALTEHLREGDRLGVVLFNRNAYKAKPIRLTQETDMDAIKSHMLDLNAGGGTNMDAGMRMATDMLQPYTDSDQDEYENRIVFLTDAMPNIGRTSEDSLLGMTESNAADNIHTTFVGMGVDFNTELVNTITAIRGANYFSVHSADQFRERMDENFKYMVTPLVFDLNVTLESEGYSIDRVYGSTAANESTGQVMRVNTLFPSPTRDDETRGGVVLLRLDETDPTRDLTLSVSYEDRSGEEETSQRTISFQDHAPEHFDHDGIRKAVLLTRYVDLMKNWVIYEQGQLNETVPQKAYDRAAEPGIEPPRDDLLNEWEQQSQSLVVSDTYETKISQFNEYFEQEMATIDDDSLSQESELMETLLAQ